MSNIRLSFIKKINLFTVKLIKYFSYLIKNIISGSRKISKKSIDNIELNKVKWELKKNKHDLGNYIYKSNVNDNAFNFSDDENFDKIIRKIKENENFINTSNNNKVEK